MVLVEDHCYLLEIALCFRSLRVSRRMLESWTGILFLSVAILLIIALAAVSVLRLLFS